MASGVQGLIGVPRRLCHQNLSLARDHRLHRILTLAGHDLRLGLPRPGDGVVVWGQSPTAWRGEALSRRVQAPLVRIEDAFLRSVLPGRAGGAATLGFLVDPVGVHFDSSRPSRLEQILADQNLYNSDILNEAGGLIDCLI